MARKIFRDQIRGLSQASIRKRILSHTESPPMFALDVDEIASADYLTLPERVWTLIQFLTPSDCRLFAAESLDMVSMDAELRSTAVKTARQIAFGSIDIDSEEALQAKMVARDWIRKCHHLSPALYPPVDQEYFYQVALASNALLAVDSYFAATHVVSHVTDAYIQLALQVKEEVKRREDRVQHDLLNRLVDWYTHPTTRRDEHRKWM